MSGAASFNTNGECYQCGQKKADHRDTGARYVCPIPLTTPLPKVPPNFKSKTALYDVFKPCKKCHVKKYTNRETGHCFSCTGMP